MRTEHDKGWNIWSNAQWAEREGDKGAHHLVTWGNYRMKRGRK